MEFETHKQRAYTMVARLEMVSHGTTQSFNGSGGRGGDVVALFPPGGVVPKDDREDPQLKSHVYFRRQLETCRTEDDYSALADEVESVLARWRRAARPPRDSNAWREAVATDTRRASVVAEEWGISKSYVHQLRQAHRRKREAA